jgi:hypothetical protein
MILGTIAGVVFAGLVLQACATGGGLPRRHPMELTSSPQCTDCHIYEEGVSPVVFEAYNHSGDFSVRHRFLAARTDRLCVTCHERSFCVDCHASKDELKPSVKYQDRPERRLPHRGDYMSQHKIDGKLDPAPCFRCHGRENNDLCKRCHR